MPTAGLPRASSGTKSSGGAVISARPPHTSFGACSMKSRYARMISRACGRGNASIPPITIGPTGCRSNSNSVTAPKFPPPPFRPQKRSGFSSALARTTLPSAVTTSAERMLSQVAP